MHTMMKNFDVDINTFAKVYLHVLYGPISLMEQVIFRILLHELMKWFQTLRRARGIFIVDLFCLGSLVQYSSH